MPYLCVKCMNEIETKPLKGRITCPYCSEHVLIKKRPEVVKRVKAR